MSWSGSAASSTLTLADMSQVIEDLSPIAGKWRAIGTQLCLVESTLKSIESSHSNPSDRLKEVISKWILSGGATLKAMIEALKSPKVGEPRLAAQLNVNHSASRLSKAATGTAKKMEGKFCTMHCARANLVLRT